jgi:flagellar biosynthesis/type III secretory pathway chaperone
MDELVAILLAEAQTYRQLVPLVEDEQRALVQADAAALAELTGRREAVLARLARLERDRQAALGRLAVLYGVEARGLTVSRLLELAPGSAASLQPVRAELRALLTGLLDRHGRNRVVAERTLACLRGLFSKLVSALTGGATYTPSGRSDQPIDQLRLLDRSA